MSSAAAPAPASDPNVRVRRRLHVTGVMQGVGFRPFVHRLARRDALGGSVRNEGWGVAIEVEGEAPALDAFAHALLAEAPLLARVDAVAARLVVSQGERAFSIEASATAGPTARWCRPTWRRAGTACASCGPGRSPLPLPVHQMHRLRATLDDRAYPAA